MRLHKAQERSGEFVKSSQEKTNYSTKQLSVPAMRVLHIGLPLIILELTMVLFSLLRDRVKNAIYALYYYPTVLEYILMSLTLIIIGAFLFDYLAKKE